MDSHAQDLARAAMGRIETALAGGPDVDHQMVSEAVRSVVTLRNHIIELAKIGNVEPDLLSQINSIVSLAFGSEYPLMGIHRHRIEQTRDALRKFVCD